MKKKAFIFILAAVLVSGLLSSCSVLRREIEQYSSDKEECILNSDNVTQFTYQEKSFTILNDTVTKKDLGAWVGYIRQLAVIDASGKILLKQDTKKATIKTLADIADKEPNAFAVIPFLNVYETKDNAEKNLIVDVNGRYHKAVQTEAVKNSDQIFRYDQEQFKTASANFTVNPKDCTQVMRADHVYQITDTPVSDEQIGEFLDVIAQSIVFDKETKLEIPKEDLLKIDWGGKGSSQQQRESWAYGEVHAIQNTDVSDSVAVEINSEYRIAAGR